MHLQVNLLEPGVFMVTLGHGRVTGHRGFGEYGCAKIKPMTEAGARMECAG